LIGGFVKKLLFAFSAVAFSTLAWAAPCGVGTLASYEALGTAGCTIDGHTVSNFQAVPGSSTGTPISNSVVSVSPLGGAADPGLTVSTSLTAQANAPLELAFTYQISGGPFSASVIALSNSSETADGGVTEIQNFCAGGQFGPDGVSGCSGTAGSLLTLDGIQQTDQSAFASVPFVSVTNDFELDGGLAGTATGGTFTNQFAAVPEPASWLFIGLGLCCMASLKRRVSVLVLRNKKDDLHE
jgi:hypothetical protein